MLGIYHTFLFFLLSPENSFCPYCNNHIVTVVDYENNYISYILAILVFIIFGFFMSIILVPITLIFTKSLIHR